MFRIVSPHLKKLEKLNTLNKSTNFGENSLQVPQNCKESSITGKELISLKVLKYGCNACGSNFKGLRDLYDHTRNVHMNHFKLSSFHRCCGVFFRRGLT